MLHFAASVAEDVAEFVFHFDQTAEQDEDGSTTVRFTAGEVEEMKLASGHLGTSVTVEQPARRPAFARACTKCAPPSPLITRWNRE